MFWNSSFFNRNFSRFNNGYATAKGLPPQNAAQSRFAPPSMQKQPYSNAAGQQSNMLPASPNQQQAAYASNLLNQAQHQPYLQQQPPQFQPQQQRQTPQFQPQQQRQPPQQQLSPHLQVQPLQQPSQTPQFQSQQQQRTPLPQQPSQPLAHEYSESDPPPPNMANLNNEQLSGKLKNVGTFMGYPEYTLTDAPNIENTKAAVSHNSNKNNDELKDIIQSEKNGARFYMMLSALAHNESAKNTLVSISERTDKRCGKMINLFSISQRGNFMPEDKNIRVNGDYYGGLKLAVKEETNALKSLLAAEDNVDDIATKGQIHAVIIQKLCTINELKELLNI